MIFAILHAGFSVSKDLWDDATDRQTKGMISARNEIGEYGDLAQIMAQKTEPSIWI